MTGAMQDLGGESMLPFLGADLRVWLLEFSNVGVSGF
jgi:hypothetical protein